MNFKRLMKNNKGISPIFATLILIAIAVIAGVVVYMFTSGTLATMTGGGTAAQEKISVQAASITGAGGSSPYSPYTIKVYLQQTGGPAATVNSIIVKNGAGSTVGVITTLTLSPTGVLTQGTLTSVTGLAPTVTPGATYTFTVTTAAGGSFVSNGVVAT